MKKAFAPPAVHFKGSGWARKEKASRPGKSHGSSVSSESAAGETSSGSVADTKPAGDGH